MRSICELRDRGVKIRSLAEAEAQWTRYLESDEGSSEAFVGQVLVMFARAGEDPGTAAEVHARPGGDDSEDAGRRCQPAEDRCRLRVFPQHRPAGVASGRSGAMNSVSTAVLQSWLGHRSMTETERYVELAGGYHDWVKRL